MTAPQPPLDFPAARAAALELARQTRHHRHHPADVARLLLPLALEVLDHMGGDAVLAMYVLADLVDPDQVPPPPAGGITQHPTPPRPPTRRAPHLRAVTATSGGNRS